MQRSGFNAIAAMFFMCHGYALASNVALPYQLDPGKWAPATRDHIEGFIAKQAVPIATA